MKNIKLEDSRTQLRFICEDLRAVQTLMATIEGEKAVSCERETLIVVLRALGPIISDLENVLETFETELNRESSTP